jgi:hypothetical protein
VDLTGILLIAGLAIALLLLLAVVVGPIFGWRIAAKHEEFITFTSDHVPREKIREAFVKFGWSLVGDQPSIMIARTRFSWRSWGESVSLQFRDGGADVKSECSFPSQAIDYGRNRMNVRKLIETLRKKGA